MERLGLKAGQWMGVAPQDEKPILPDIADVKAAAQKYLGIQPRSGGLVTAGELAPAALALAPSGIKAGTAAMKPVGAVISGVTDIAKNVARKLNPRAVIESIGKPSTISDVGEKIGSKVQGNLDKLVKDRKPQADKLFKDYISKGKGFEDKILADYKTALAEYYAKGVASGSLSNEQITAINKAADRLTGRASDIDAAAKNAAAARDAALADKIAAQGRKIPPRQTTTVMKVGEKIDPGMGALEKERRIWNDIAEGYDVKGAEGITAQAARDISNLLTQSIKKYVPDEFDAAMKGYQQLSEPINKFNTALGKKATAKADEYLPEVSKTDPAAIPKVFFKSRRSVEELKDLTGDDKFVAEAARDHVANDLSGAKTADEVNNYLQKNKDWLQEFPELQKQVAQAAKSLKQAERVKTAAKYGAAGVGGAEALSMSKRLFGGR